MMVRGKFRLNCIESADYGYSPPRKTYVFVAVCADVTPENVMFSKATPTGEIRMQIDNPAAQAEFVVGQHYYFDASPIPAA